MYSIIILNIFYNEGFFSNPRKRRFSHRDPIYYANAPETFFLFNKT